MKTAIFIPKKIKVGFNTRTDTYTGKLGYVIYHDGKTWRKEASWESWRGKYIKPVEYENTPLEGFVLNKKVGGYKSDWNFRQAYTRVYDPRGFEFEITIPNLLYILEHANSIKGKGLEGKFIYGWDGKDLVLLPEEAPEYKEMVEYTEALSLKVKESELKVGGIYLTKLGGNVTFLCKAPYYDYNEVKHNNGLWFYDKNDYRKFYIENISNIKKYIGDNTNIATLLGDLQSNKHFKPPTNVKVEKYVLYPENRVKNNYSFGEYVWISAKTKGKYKKAYFDGYAGFHLRTSRSSGTPLTAKYKTFKELITAHPFYIKQLENESKEQ